MFTNLILLHPTCCELSHCSHGPGKAGVTSCLQLGHGSHWVPQSPISLQHQSTFPLVFLLLLMYLQKPLSPDFTLGGLWLSYLCMLRMCLYSSRVVSPLFHLYCQELLVHTCRLPATFDWFPIHQDVPLLNLEKVILKNPSWTSLVSGIITHGILPSMFLNWPEALPYVWDVSLSQSQNALHSIQKVADHEGFL